MGPSGCKYSNPLNLFNMSFDTYLAAVGGSRGNPTAGSRSALLAAVNQFRFPDNTSVSTLGIFGGITLSPLANPPPGQPPLSMSSAKVAECCGAKHSAQPPRRTLTRAASALAWQGQASCRRRHPPVCAGRVGGLQPARRHRQLRCGRLLHSGKEHAAASVRANPTASLALLAIL